MKLQRLAKLVTASVPGERPTISLDLVGSGTMRLLGRELTRNSGLDPGLAAVEPGDVLFGKLRPYLAKVWPAEFAAHASTELMCLRPESRSVDSRWFAYLLSSQPLIDWAISSSDGAKMPRTSWERLRAFETDLPPLRIQQATTRFLDVETARIDSLVDARHRQIALLSERSNALVERTLWLDEKGRPRPAMGLRRATSRIDVGIAEAATHAYRESGTPLLRSTNIRRGFLDLGDLLFIDPEFARRRASKTIRGGDLITVRTGSVGVTAVVPPELDGCQCFTQLITTPLPGGSSQFLCMALNSGRAVEYFKLLGWGSAQANISVPTLAAAPIPDVSNADQHRIVRELHGPIARIEALVAACSKQAALLIERRQALITAAVTGQLDLAREIAEESS